MEGSAGEAEDSGDGCHAGSEGEVGDRTRPDGNGARGLVHHLSQHLRGSERAWVPAGLPEEPRPVPVLDDHLPRPGPGPADTVNGEVHPGGWPRKSARGRPWRLAIWHHGPPAVDKVHHPGVAEPLWLTYSPVHPVVAAEEVRQVHPGLPGVDDNRDPAPEADRLQHCPEGDAEAIIVDQELEPPNIDGTDPPGGLALVMEFEGKSAPEPIGYQGRRHGQQDGRSGAGRPPLVPSPAGVTRFGSCVPPAVGLHRSGGGGTTRLPDVALAYLDRAPHGTRWVGHRAAAGTDSGRSLMETLIHERAVRRGGLFSMQGSIPTRTLNAVTLYRGGPEVTFTLNGIRIPHHVLILL